MSVSQIVLPGGYDAAGQYDPVFDPTGTKSANIIPGEVQTVTANFGTDLQFLVPSYAPFFANSLTLVYTDPQSGATQTLQPGQDYFFAFPFISASRATKLPVFGGVVISNNKLAGDFKFTYNTVGGLWCNTISLDQAVELMTNIDPYATAWEQVINYSSAFPVITAPWDKPDPSGMTQVIQAVLSLRDTMQTDAAAASSGDQAALAHIFATNNPHNDTALQIALENVSNFPPATNDQASDASNAATYITPGQLKLAFAAGLPHATDTQRGTMLLNDGTQVGDSTNSTKVLTAQGFLNLVNSSNNPLGSAFNKEQVEAQFSPWPMSFPATWNGSTYFDLDSLLLAIQNFVGIYPLEFSFLQGKIWLPSGTTPPDLTTTN